MSPLVLAAQEVRQALERGVDAGAVQALGVVLDDQLPVGGDVVDDPVPHAEFLHAPGEKPRRQVGELLTQGRGKFAEVQEDVAVPEVGRHGLQWVIVLAEVRQIVHLGRGGQPTVEVVCPGVIRAANQAVEAALRGLAEASAPVAADVVVGSHDRRASARVTITLSPATSRST